MGAEYLDHDAEDESGPSTSCSALEVHRGPLVHGFRLCRQAKEA